MKKDIHTLKELNLDAARYRWVRENFSNLEPEELDQVVDEGIEKDVAGRTLQ